MNRSALMTIAALALLLPRSGSGSGACNQADALFNDSLSRTDQREALLRQALTLCPDHIKARNNLAVLEESLGHLDQAELHYRQLIRLQPGFAPAYAGLGDVLARRGEYRGAANAYAIFLDILRVESREEMTPGAMQAYRGLYRDKLAAVQQQLDPGRTVPSQEITAALSAPPVTGRTKRGIRVVMRPPQIDINIHFATDSDQVAPEALPQLAQVARALASEALGNAVIRLEGHTDSTGTVDYNRELSLRRANRIRTVLIDTYGLDPGRLQVAGRGEEQPVAGNDSDQGRALNRRVTFINVSHAR